MKTQMKTVFVFLVTMAVAVSCGKNESGSPNNNYGVGGSYNVVDGSTSEASKQAFEQARSWFNGSEKSLRSNLMVRSYFNSSTTNNNCNTGSWWIIDYSYCSGSNSTSNASQTVYTCLYSNGSNSSIGYKQVSNYQDCYASNVSATSYSKNNNTELKKILSLNNNQWALYSAQNNNGLITIAVGPKTTTNVYNPTATLYYQIDTNIHSVYNPVYVEDKTSGTFNVINF